MLPSILILKITPSTNMYFIFSWDKSRFRHFSTAPVKSLFALLTSSWDISRPISLLLSIDNVRVLIPVRYMTDRSSAILSSYRLLRGNTCVWYSPFRSLGTFTCYVSNPFNTEVPG